MYHAAGFPLHHYNYISFIQYMTDENEYGINGSARGLEPHAHA